jgi:hypothetical protein
MAGLRMGLQELTQADRGLARAKLRYSFAVSRPQRSQSRLLADSALF